jgi:Mn-containing catalase
VRFEKLLPEQFGCSYGELKVAMQYFVQAFGCKKPYPDKYDMLMDIDTEEFIHLEIVEAAIQMLLTCVNCDICSDVFKQNTPLHNKKQPL